MIGWQDIFRELYKTGNFDPDFYLRRYPDVALSGMLPLEHYAKYGAEWGRVIAAQQKNQMSDEIRLGNVAQPRVTVICTTYNHAAFIADTLDGFVAQRTNFPFEVLISDDCSTDETPRIIMEYAKQYPFIKYIKREHNIGSIPNLMDLAARVRSEYVAICEGDDYWTDAEKLQIQVDFLDKNLEYALSFHQVSILFEDDIGRTEVFPPEDHDDFTLARLAQSNFIQTNSVMYRWRYKAGLPQEFAGIHPGDWYMHLLHAEMGRIGYINRNMAVYRKHKGGMWSDAATNPTALHLKYGAGEIRMFEAMKSHFGGQYDDLMLAMQKHVIAEVFDHYVNNGDARGLAGFIWSTKPLQRFVLNICNIETTEKHLSCQKNVESLLEERFGISVIITSYNHGKYLSQCLDSILLQKGAFKLEIIIGDDCSTDNSQNVIDTYIKKRPDVIRQVKHSKNIGMLNNMRLCFDAAKMPFIAICEGDDYWISSYKLAKQMSFLFWNKECSMVFNWVMLYEEWNLRFLPHNFQSTIHKKRLKFSEIAAEPLTANFSACFYRAETIKAIPKSYYKQRGAADWLFNLYAAKIGDVGFIPDLMSVYRVHRDGQWSGMSTKDKKGRINQVRNEFHQIFGDGFGFNDEYISYTVEQENFLAAGHFIAWLDRPVDRTVETVSGGEITVSGWAVTALGGPVTVLVEYLGEITEYSTDVSRKDVATALANDRGLSLVSENCGFKFSLSYRKNQEARVGLRLRGQPIWWLKIGWRATALPLETRGKLALLEE